MERIQLSNRYGDKNYLEKIDENIYILRLAENSKDYCRFGLREGHDWEDKEYDFVDPSGGPFIQINNYCINDKPVKYIYEQEGEIVIEI